MKTNIRKLSIQVGVAGGKILLSVLLAFGLVNFLLIAYALFRVLTTNFLWTTIGIFGLVVVLAVGFTLSAFYLTYRYLIRLVIQNAYALTLEQRIKITEEVVRKAAHIFNGQQEIHHKQLRQTIDWSKTVYRYYQAVPVFFQSGITQYLNRIPTTQYIIDLKEDILARNYSLAAEKLRTSIDTFFEERILGSPTNRLTWLLLLVNILVLYGLITWGIGPAPWNPLASP